MADGKTLLLVDDEQELMRATKIRLEARGYHVVTASDGLQALEVMEKERPDLVILDIMMPVMDGYTCLLESTKRFGRGTFPVIVLTARDQIKELFDLEGVEDYLVKPYDHEELVIRIGRILKQRTNSAESPGSSD